MEFFDTLAQIIVTKDVFPAVSADSARLRLILNIVFGIAGGIALLVITIAGFRYVISHGDPSLIARSKNAIIYALVGLAVCMAALGIVNFVMGKV